MFGCCFPLQILSLPLFFSQFTVEVLVFLFWCFFLNARVRTDTLADLLLTSDPSGTPAEPEGRERFHSSSQRFLGDYRAAAAVFVFFSVKHILEGGADGDIFNQFIE